MRLLLLSASALALVACSNEPAATASSNENGAQESATSEASMSAEATTLTAEERLDAVLAAQSEETKARYQYRHPKETLQFFGVEPGMTVVDTLPGSVWYAGILGQYVGPEGRVIGADFSLDQRKAMGGRYGSDEWQAEHQNWPAEWAAEQNALHEDDAPVEAFFYGSAPEALFETVDVVLVVRAAHHFNRTEEAGGYFSEAIADMMNLLKPGGVVGVVQHRAPEGNSDEWAVGRNGYVKQSRVIEVFENAGFELVETSEINANPKDQPTEEDFVWRLPPSGKEEAMLAIGESDRMTLKFRKPA